MSEKNWLAMEHRLRYPLADEKPKAVVMPVLNFTCWCPYTDCQHILYVLAIDFEEGEIVCPKCRRTYTPVLESRNNGMYDSLLISIEIICKLLGDEAFRGLDVSPLVTEIKAKYKKRAAEKPQ